MAVTEIPWNDGSGDKIYLTRNVSEGDQTVAVSSDANTGAARSKTVTFTSGVGNITRTLTVNQEAGLPYTPLEYIQTDGVAYINSGVLGNVIRSFQGKIKLNSTISSSEVIVGCGNTDGATSTFSGAYRASNATDYLGLANYYFYSKIADISNALSDAFEFRSIIRSGTNTLGIKKAGDTSYTDSTKTINRNTTTGKAMYIFASNYQDAPVRKMASGERLYYLKIYNNIYYSTNNDGLLFDGIPVLYNGEYGLWDLVSNSFFGNVAGSGAFTGA